MGLYDNYIESISNIYDYVEDESNIDKFFKLLDSNLSILRIWISLFGEDVNIKPRANNIYYTSFCPHHYMIGDMPVCIDENKKTYHCYGCGYGGTIVSLVVSYYSVTEDEAIEILYSYVSNDISGLSKKQLEIFKEIFKNYNSPVTNKYFKISEEKTAVLNNRISNYIQANGDSSETIKKMCKRLCCTKKHVQKNKTSNMCDDFPF